MAARKKRKKKRSFDPWRDRAAAVEAVLAARKEGATLRKAAEIAGVHVATVCRWAVRCESFAEALADAEMMARRRRYAPRIGRRKPRVPWHPCCPECGAAVCVRRVYGSGPAFWLCSRWPRCPWASWRPRFPKDCPLCAGPLYWSCSRKSIHCPVCDVRIYTD